MKPTLIQLNVLTSVARAGSVSGAARILGMTQSGVSQSLIALEKMLGSVLFTRTQSGVAPTAFALTILRDAQEALDAVDRVRSFARASSPATGQELRFAGVPSVIAHRLPVWRKNYQRLHPSVELSIFEGSHTEVNEWVMSGIADLGISSVAPEGSTAVQLFEEELVIVARRGHPILRRELARLEDLSLDKLVTAGAGCEPIIARLFDAAGRKFPLTVKAQGIATALCMVRQGIGVTILPETLVQGLEMIGLRVRYLTPSAHRPLYMIALPERASQTPVRIFMDIVRMAEPNIAGH